MERTEEQRHSCCQSSPDSEAFLRATDPARMKNDQRERERVIENERAGDAERLFSHRDSSL